MQRRPEGKRAGSIAVGLTMLAALTSACGGGSTSNTVDGSASESCIGKPEGTPCGDSSETECDLPDTCDGAGNCRSNLAPEMRVCTECETAPDCDCLGGICSTPRGLQLGTDSRPGEHGCPGRRHGSVGQRVRHRVNHSDLHVGTGGLGG